MDGWLKALVAGACLVIICGGAYYGWNEYQSKKRTEAAEAERTMLSGCRFTLSSAGSGSNTLRDYCVEKGYITRDQANRAAKGDYIN